MFHLKFIFAFAFTLARIRKYHKNPNGRANIVIIFFGDSPINRLFFDKIGRAHV